MSIISMCTRGPIWFLLLIIYGVHSAEDELDAVVVVFRHGDRTPIKPYPLDPYRNASFWPVDFGQLTNRGKLQHLQLGKWLRRRYQNFLPLTYSEKDIYVRSTDVDRTLMSAEANLAGLYPPVSSEIWDSDIKWQPIPIHTKPEVEDAMLAAKKPCAKFDKLYKQLLKSSYFQNITHQYHDLLAYLSRHAGEPISDLQKLEYLFSTLFIETLYNLTLPNWTDPVYPDKMKPLASLSFAIPTYTTEMAKLKTGPFFNHLIDFFNNHTLKTVNTQKLLMFSAHDTTIANLLNTMGAFEYHPPPYTSTIIFELRKRYNGRNYVSMFYKNTSEAQQITLRQCEEKCDLADFITILKPISITLEQWDYECRIKWASNWPLNLVGNIILGIILVTINLLAVIVVLCLKKSKKNSEMNYVPIPNEEFA